MVFDTYWQVGGFRWVSLRKHGNGHALQGVYLGRSARLQVWIHHHDTVIGFPFPMDGVDTSESPALIEGNDVVCRQGRVYPDGGVVVFDGPFLDTIP